MTQNEEKLKEVFGEDFVDKVNKLSQGEAGNPTPEQELYLSIASLYNCIDRGIGDTITILSTMDAEEHQEEFQMFEDILEALQETESFISSEEVKNIQERDYELNN